MGKRIVYQIARWDEEWESARSQRLDKDGNVICGIDSCSHAYTPNKQHGDRFIALMKHPDGLEAYGLFSFLAGMCSLQRMPRHGFLTLSGDPKSYAHTPRDMGNMTFKSTKTIEKLLKVLISDNVGWIKTCVVDEETHVQDTLKVHAVSFEKPLDDENEIKNKDDDEEREHAVAVFMDQLGLDPDDATRKAPAEVLRRQIENFRARKTPPDNPKGWFAAAVRHDYSLSDRARKAREKLELRQRAKARETRNLKAEQEVADKERAADQWLARLTSEQRERYVKITLDAMDEKSKEFIKIRDPMKNHAFGRMMYAQFLKVDNAGGSG
jgi:hypothetical protein